MNIKITEIHNRGNYNQEYVELQVTADCNLGDYAIYDTSYSGGKESNIFPHFFRFPNQQVKSGDSIKLYTRPEYYIPGFPKFPYSFTKTFYWCSEHAIWNNRKDQAYLIKIEETQTVKTDYDMISELLDNMFNNSFKK